jgi:hypothetical protein
MLHIPRWKPVNLRPARLIFAIACVLVTIGLAAEADGATPQVLGRISVKRIDEVSGLAVSQQNPDILWVHNDGKLKQIFAVASTGKLAVRVRIPVSIDDVEDIAIGPGPESGNDYIYLGDIGDNNQDRREIRVVRFLEPNLTGVREKEISAEGVEVIRLLYPDGPHDAETLFVEHQTGDVYIATKEKARTGLYRAAAGKLQASLPVVVDLVAQLNVTDVSAGDISRSGTLVALRRESQGWLWSRRPNESFALALRRYPKPLVVLGDGQSPNGESIGFSPDGTSYYTISEGKQQPIAVFPVPSVGSTYSSAR